MRKTNKKYILAAFLVGIGLIGLTSCKKKPAEVKQPVIEEEEIVSEESQVLEDKIVKEFLDKVKSEEESSIGRIQSFLHEKKGKITDLDLDMVFLKLEKHMEERENSIHKELVEKDLDRELVDYLDKGLFFKEEDIDNLKNEELKAYVRQIYDEDFRLISLEGDFYGLVDYDKMALSFEAASDEIKDYIEIRRSQLNSPAAIDGAIVIPFEQLSKRLIARENYIKKYSSSKKYDEVLSGYKNELSLYLNGTDSTKIYDEETKLAYEEVLKNYKLTSNVKDSSTALVVQKYLKAIEENEKKIDASIKEISISLLAEAISLLESMK